MRDVQWAKALGAGRRGACGKRTVIVSHSDSSDGTSHDCDCFSLSWLYAARY